MCALEPRKEEKKKIPIPIEEKQISFLHLSSKTNRLVARCLHKIAFPSFTYYQIFNLLILFVPFYIGFFFPLKFFPSILGSHIIVNVLNDGFFLLFKNQEDKPSEKKYKEIYRKWIAITNAFLLFFLFFLLCVQAMSYCITHTATNFEKKKMIITLNANSNIHRKHWNNIRNGMRMKTKKKKKKKCLKRKTSEKKKTKELKIILNNQPMNVLFVLIYLQCFKWTDDSFSLFLVLYSVLVVSFTFRFFFLHFFSSCIQLFCLYMSTECIDRLNWIYQTLNGSFFVFRLFNFQLKDIHLQSSKEYEQKERNITCDFLGFGL